MNNADDDLDNDATYISVPAIFVTMSAENE